MMIIKSHLDQNLADRGSGSLLAGDKEAVKWLSNAWYAIFIILMILIIIINS